MGKHSLGIPLRRLGAHLHRSNRRLRALAAHRHWNRLHDLEIRSRAIRIRAISSKQHGPSRLRRHCRNDGVILDLHPNLRSRQRELLHRVRGPVAHQHHFRGAVDE